ncbi:bacillithiol system redox-active protein YtxJ [Hyphobacterium sp. CCMP332]|nr:bacillithiol system redox-active protein YtxJ [Hyphobacterium sp. CCMP332]
MTKNEKWIELTDSKQLGQLDRESKEMPVIIFKHSTSCSISAMAWGRFNRGLESHPEKECKYYYLDLLKYRTISQEISEKYEIRHESPQILIILKGKCVQNASHFEVNFSKVLGY